MPCAAAIYVDDMYVPRAFSEDTARRVRGLRPWITNEFEHDGIRAARGSWDYADEAPLRDALRRGLNHIARP